MPRKMHLNRVTIAAFKPDQRKSIAAYIGGPLCDMIHIRKRQYFVNNILHSTPSKYHLTADCVFVEGRQLKIESMVDVIRRALELAEAKPHTLVRFFEFSANGESKMVFDKRFRNM